MLKREVPSIHIALGKLALKVHQGRGGLCIRMGEIIKSIRGKGTRVFAGPE